MPSINCEIELLLIWSKDCVITNSEGEGKFQITETKLYVPVMTLSTQDNVKLLQQLKSSFKKIINWNKYESDIRTYAQNRYLNHLINPSFPEGKQTFCPIFWKWRSEKITLNLLSSKSRNKRLQCYDWW